MTLQRLLIDMIFACLGALVCVSALFALKQDLLGDEVARIGFGVARDDALPLSIQALSWIVFAIGLGELAVRARESGRQSKALGSDLLPSGHGQVFRVEDLGDVYRRARKLGRDLMLARAVMRVISSFQISRSASQSSSVLQSTMTLFEHEVDLRYNFLRYLLWLLPSLGFIGTVWGIGSGLGVISRNELTVETAQDVLKEVTAELSVAFDTTLVALLLTSVLAYVLHIVQTREEKIMNDIGQRCVDDLVNQLLED